MFKEAAMAAQQGLYSQFPPPKGKQYCSKGTRIHAGSFSGHFSGVHVFIPNNAPTVDPEIQTIIDKLATFVARNGPEFEQMTMNKQRNNPKFQFLFGGEYNPYYRWKVASEQAGEYCPLEPV